MKKIYFFIILLFVLGGVSFVNSDWVRNGGMGSIINNYFNVTQNNTIMINSTDGNNYSTSVEIIGTTTKTIIINRSGMVNINTTFTDESSSVNGTSINITKSYISNGLVFESGSEPLARNMSVTVFSEEKANISHLAYKNGENFDSYVQPRLADKQTVFCQPLMMGTSTTVMGCTGSGAFSAGQGTISNPPIAPIAESWKSLYKWTTSLSVATAGVNASTSIRSTLPIFIGNSTINGTTTYISSIFGFHNGATAKANNNANTSGFVGLSTSSSQFTNTSNAYAQTNLFGIGFNNSNLTLGYIRNDASGVTELVLNCGSNYPSPIANTNASYQIMFYTNGKNSTIYSTLKRKDISGITPCEYSFAPVTNMPTTNSLLYFRIDTFKGIEASAVAVALANYYQENDI